MCYTLVVKPIITEITQVLGAQSVEEMVNILKSLEQESFEEEEASKKEMEKKFVSEQSFVSLLENVDFDQEVVVDWSESSVTAETATVEKPVMQKPLVQQPVKQVSSTEVTSTVSSASITTSEGFNVQVSFRDFYYNPL